MGARTGEEFLKGLATGTREVWLGDERVDDIVGHPAFAGAAQSLASVFDAQHTHADECLMTDSESGEQVNISHMIPRSVEDLKRRRIALTRISEQTVGLMGRTPDYMNVTYAGFAGERTPWSGPDGRNAGGYENLQAFQRRLALDDLSLTHTIVQPTIDRAIDNINYVNNPVPLHKVGETADTIIVRGARILSTLAPFADEIAVYPGLPLPPGTPAEYGLSFSIPMSTPGLIFLCRDNAATVGSNAFDHPLSSRFDEQDAFVIFDNVEIPKDWVFIDSDPETYSGVMGATGWWPNIMQQTTTRALTKMEFAYGLGCRLAEAVNDTQPTTADMLGEIAAYIDITRAALDNAEDMAYDRGDGAVFPHGRPLHPLRSLLATWFPRVREILVTIGSHNLLAAPSRGMLRDERMGALAAEFLHGAGDLTAERRAALHRLAWDFVGSGLAGRNDLYERNYLGSARNNRQHLHGMYFDRTRAYELVESMLAPVR